MKNYEFEEVMSLVSSIDSVDNNLNDEEFLTHLLNLLNYLDIDLCDIQIPLNQLKMQVARLRAELEVIEFYDDYISSLDELISEFKSDITGKSIILSSEQTRTLLLNEVFK